MSWLPDSASFHEQVQACFVAYRGRGLALSEKDLVLVDRWADAQVPVEVVARGIKKAVEALGWDQPEHERVRGLSACRRHVDAEIEKYLKQTAGRGDADAPVESFLAVRHKKLLGALRKLAKDQPALGAAAARLGALPEPTDFDQAERHETLVLVMLLRAAPFAQRLECLQKARAFVQKSQPMTSAARHEALRFHLAAQARSALSLPPFW